MGTKLWFCRPGSVSPWMELGRRQLTHSRVPAGVAGEKRIPQTGESAPGTGLCLGAPEDRRSGDAGFGVWSALSWGPGLDPNLGHTLPRSGSLGAPCRLLGSGGSGHDVWGPARSLHPAPGQHAGAERPG